MSQKRKEDIATLDKWLTYHLVIGYELIDQGKCCSPSDPKEDLLSADSGMAMKYVKGLIGCGLDDFESKEWRPPPMQFSNPFNEKAWKFFSKLKFQKALPNPIREYMSMVHKDCMNTIRMFGWRLDEVVELSNQPFTDEIETLSLHFDSTHWTYLYNGGKGWERESMKRACSVLLTIESVKAILFAKILQPNSIPLLQCHLFCQSLLLVRSIPTLFLCFSCYICPNFANMVSGYLTVLLKPW